MISPRRVPSLPVGFKTPFIIVLKHKHTFSYTEKGLTLSRSLSLSVQPRRRVPWARCRWIAVGTAGAPTRRLRRPSAPPSTPRDGATGTPPLVSLIRFPSLSNPVSQFSLVVRVFAHTNKEAVRHDSRLLTRIQSHRPSPALLCSASHPWPSDPSLTYRPSVTHPAFWHGANPRYGVDVALDTSLFRFYYNHSRPEMFDSRKDLASTLSNRGARLAKEVGKGLALIHMHLLTTEEGGGDTEGGTLRPVTRFRSGMVPSAAELKAIATSASDGGCNGTAPWALSNLRPCGPLHEWGAEAPYHAPQEGDGFLPLSLCVEVHGSVNAQPLVEWLKLCVDQTLHDYVMERLLAGVRQPCPSSSLKDPSPVKEKDPSPVKDSSAVKDKEAGIVTLSGGGGVIRPLHDLLRSGMSLDNPSVRRHECTELLPPATLPWLAQMLARALHHVHPYFAPHPALYTRAADDQAFAERPDDTTDNGRIEEAAGVEMLTLCGLRMPAAPQKPVDPTPSTISASPESPPLRAPIPLRSSGALLSSTSIHRGHGSATCVTPLWGEGDSLGPGDVLYPHVSTGEGASTELIGLRATWRGALGIVHVTPCMQTLVLYNVHPDLYARCVAAVSRVLSLASLQRFLTQAVGLHKLGLLPLDLPYWRHMPPLLKMIEARGGMVLGSGEAPRVEDGAKEGKPTGGAGSQGPKADPANANAGKGAEGGGRAGQGGGGGGAKEAVEGGGAGGRPLQPTEAGAGGEEASKPAPSASGPMPPLIKKVSGVKPSEGPVMTPAMAARLRASGRAGPGAQPKRKIPPPTPTPSTASSAGPPPLPSSTSNPVHAPNAAPQPTGGSSGATGGGGGGSSERGGKPLLPGSTSVAPATAATSGGPTGPAKRESDPPSSSTSTSTALHPVSSAVVEGPGTLPLPDFDLALHGAVTWMGTLMTSAQAQSPQLRALTRLLLQLLPTLLPDLDHPLPSHDPHPSLPSLSSSTPALHPYEGQLGSPGGRERNTHAPPDPLWRLQAQRLKRGPLPFFVLLSSRARVRSLMRPWLWRQSLLQLQHKASLLHARMARPLELTMPKKASDGGAPEKRAHPDGKPTGEGGEAQQPPSTQSDPDVESIGLSPPPPRDPICLSARELSVLLGLCRWQSCWSIPILLPVTTVHLPVLVRALDFPLMTPRASLPLSSLVAPPPAPVDSGGEAELGPEVSSSITRAASYGPLHVSEPEGPAMHARSRSAHAGSISGSETSTLSRSRATSSLAPLPEPSGLLNDPHEQAAPLKSTALRSGASIERSHLELAGDLMARYTDYLVGLHWTPLHVAWEGGQSHVHLHDFTHRAPAWPLKAYLQRPLPHADSVLVVEVLCSRRNALATPSAGHNPSSEPFSMTVTLFSLDVPEPPPSPSAPLALPTTLTFHWPDPSTPRRSPTVSLPEEICAFSTQVQLSRHVYNVTLERTIDFLQAASGQPGSTSFLLTLLRTLLRRYPEPPRYARPFHFKGRKAKVRVTDIFFVTRGVVVAVAPTVACSCSTRSTPAASTRRTRWRHTRRRCQRRRKMIWTSL